MKLFELNKDQFTDPDKIKPRSCVSPAINRATARHSLA
jgi:hypothetical protein